VFINADGNGGPGVLQWDRAEYLVKASGDTSVVTIQATTEARTALTVTDFHLVYRGGGDTDGDGKPRCVGLVGRGLVWGWEC
jgi:hypothetical protein